MCAKVRRPLSPPLHLCRRRCAHACCSCCAAVHNFRRSWALGRDNPFLRLLIAFALLHPEEHAAQQVYVPPQRSERLSGPNADGQCSSFRAQFCDPRLSPLSARCPEQLAYALGSPPFVPVRLQGRLCYSRVHGVVHRLCWVHDGRNGRSGPPGIAQWVRVGAPAHLRRRGIR